MLPPCSSHMPCKTQQYLIMGPPKLPPTCLESVFNSFQWTHHCLTGLRFIFIFRPRMSEETSYHTAVTISNGDKFAHLNEGELTFLLCLELFFHFWQNFINHHLFCCCCFGGSLKSQPTWPIISHRALFDWQARKGNVLHLRECVGKYMHSCIQKSMSAGISILHFLSGVF